MEAQLVLVLNMPFSLRPISTLKRLSPVNAAEFLSAVRVHRLGWRRLRSDLWTHSSCRLPQVVHGISEGKLEWRNSFFFFFFISKQKKILRFVCVCVFGSIQNDQVLQGFSVDKGEFTCPLCRQFANSVLPCRPGRDVEAGKWHSPTNKKMCLLVKEVEELQERIGLFPVRRDRSRVSFFFFFFTAVHLLSLLSACILQ